MSQNVQTYCKNLATFYKILKTSLTILVHYASKKGLKMVNNEGKITKVKVNSVLVQK